MNLIVIQKENDAAILRGLSTGNCYVVLKSDRPGERSGWFITKQRLDGHKWRKYPRTELERDVADQLGLDCVNS